MQSRLLTDYLSRYGGTNDWHLKVFRRINDRFSPQHVLYPGSWIHVTPSLVFPDVVYVDLYKHLTRAFNDPDVQQYIVARKEYPQCPRMIPYQTDYRDPFGEVLGSFDLLLSLSSGFVSQACGMYLKPDGILLVNDEHYDAGMAYVDPKYTLIGIFTTDTTYLDSKEMLQQYFLTTTGRRLTRAMVQANSQRSHSKAQHKLTKRAPCYVFHREH